MQNEDKKSGKISKGRLKLEPIAGPIDIAERTHQEALKDLEKDNDSIHLYLTLYRGDRRWLTEFAKAEGVTLGMLCRRVLRNFLLARPYLSSAEVQAIRNCYRELCEVFAALTSNGEGINKLVDAGVVNECYREVSENNLSLAEKVEALIVLVRPILVQAETQAELAGRWE